MKSKLLISLLLLSSVCAISAEHDSLKVVSRFALRLDPTGSEVWTHRAENARKQCVVTASFVEKHMSPKMIQAFKDSVAQNPIKTVFGYHVYQALPKIVQPAAPKVDHSKLLVSLKTKVKPNLSVQFLNASRQEADFYARIATGLYDKALSASALNQIAAEATASLPKVTPAVAATASTAAAATATAATVTPSRVAQFATQHPNKVFPMYLAGALVGGTALYAGINQAFAYMKPTEVKPLTYFERAQAALSSGCKTVQTAAIKGYNLALENKGKTAGGLALVAAAGYVAYKNKEAIFGKSKNNSVKVSEAIPAPVRLTFKPARPYSRG